MANFKRCLLSILIPFIKWACDGKQGFRSFHAREIRGDDYLGNSLGRRTKTNAPLRSSFVN